MNLKESFQKEYYLDALTKMNEITIKRTGNCIRGYRAGKCIQSCYECIQLYCKEVIRFEMQS